MRNPATKTSKKYKLTVDHKCRTGIAKAKLWMFDSYAVRRHIWLKRQKLTLRAANIENVEKGKP